MNYRHSIVYKRKINKTEQTLEKLIQIQDQEVFSQQLRLIIREELSILLSNNQQAPQDGKIINREDIMKLYNISVATLWKRMGDGTIPYFKVGRRVYFYENIVKQALNK